MNKPATAPAVPATLDTSARERLKDVARQAIRHGLDYGHPPDPHLRTFPSRLQAPGACFVTLTLEGNLRGCLGSLETCRPLVEDVVENAFAAAFRDPRFAPLKAHEYDRIALSISVLSAAEAVACTSEADLVAALQPGVHGLILEEGAHIRATFLPAVWEHVRRPEDFVRHLKAKAGLPPDYWSPTLRIKRYTTELIA